MSDTVEPPPLIPAIPRDKAQTRFLQILEATTDVVAMSDRRGRLLFLNRAGRALLGWPAGEMARRHLISELFPPWIYQIVLHDAIPTALDRGSWSGETALACADGREMPVLQVMLAHHGTDGEMEFFSTICRDISDRKQKELERIEWANRYDAAIRASGQVLFDWDSTSGEITYGGDVHTLLGYSAEEMAGGLARLRQIIHPEDLQAFDHEIERVLFTRDPFHHEFKARRKDGEVIFIDAQGFFFLDRQGRIGRMVGFLRNVTAERAAEQAIQSANERLELRVAERTAALELSARRQEAVARLGQRALAGLSLDQLTQEAVEIAHHGLQADFGSVLEYDAEHAIFVVRAEIGWPVHGSTTYIPGATSSQSGYAMLTGKAVVSEDLANEQRFTISETVREAGARSGMSACIQAGDRPLGVVNVFHRELRQYGADDVNFLQAVANVLTAAIERNRVESDLRRARADAEAANRGKSEFLSRMSHELRTPLNAILGFGQLLEMEEHNPRQAESIHHITRAGQNLLNLINEVLDIARLDAGRMQLHIEPVELGEFLRETMAISSSLAVQRGVELRLDLAPNAPPLHASADRERLKQALLNLLSNAVKFNRPNGVVSVKLEQSGTRLRIVITDSGFGIPADKLDHLFVPFQRWEPKDGTQHGAGLGLALTQKLIGALGGEVSVTSTVDVGSTFVVELPAATAPSPSPAETAPAAPAAGTAAEEPPQRTVLYIEDDAANFYLLERILQSRKHIKLVSALQGSLGLELARSQNPDLILLDLNLPDMTGEQLLRSLKENPETASIPVIAVTGEVASNRPDALQQLGALGTLVKPYRVQDLTRLVDAALQSVPPSS